MKINNLKKKNHQNISLIGTLLIVTTYFLAFFFNEDSSGGGQLDFEKHIFNNFLIFFSSNLKEINWEFYDSTSLPLHYIISKFLIFSDQKNYYRYFWFIFSFLGPVLLYILIRVSPQFKNNSKFENIFLSSCILLSPYYRTSSVWGLEENIGIVCLLTALIFYKLYLNNSSQSSLILLILFTCLTFLSRQSYIFLILIIFFSIINFNHIFKKNNFLICLYFFIFLIPSMYFFNIWNSLFPPMADSRSGFLKINNLPTILNIILIYILPFAFIWVRNVKIKIQLKQLIIIFLLFIFYFFLFSTYTWTNNGSGAIPKLLTIFIESYQIKKSILLISSFISLIFIFLITQNNNILRFFFILNIFIFTNIDVVFHEYFDPITFIFLIIFGKNKILRNKKIQIQRILAPYLALFLISSIIYH